MSHELSARLPFPRRVVGAKLQSTICARRTSLMGPARKGSFRAFVVRWRQDRTCRRRPPYAARLADLAARLQFHSSVVPPASMMGACATWRGYDWTPKFPLIAGAMASLPAISIVLDGDAVYCDDDRIADFNSQAHKPLEAREAKLEMLLAMAPAGLQFNEHNIDGDGAVVFEHACRPGPMILSCRLGGAVGRVARLGPARSRDSPPPSNRFTQGTKGGQRP
jgi:hypothetical protein